MKQIIKSTEPVSLAQYRANRSSNYTPSYKDYQPKDDLRESLSLEQGAICCYCLSRIEPTEYGMKIEHWKSQSEFASEQLDYDNLLGACNGNEGNPPYMQHCDTSKGSQELSVNPAGQGANIDSRIQYLHTGEVAFHEPKLNDELEEVLNLNYPRLKENRKKVLDVFRDTIGAGDLTRPQIRRLLEDWSTPGPEGKYEPYCQLVIYWLEKRLARS